MDRERLDNLIEKSILGLVISALCYGPIAFGAVNKRHFLVIQALVALALFLWFARIWINPKHRVLFPPTCWAVLAFVIYAGVRYWQADVEYVARQEFLKIVTYASLFFLVLNNLCRQEHLRAICSALIILGFCISVYAIFQYLTESKLVLGRPQPEQFYGRASGTYICPNHLAGFLEMLVPISIAMTLLVKMGPVKRILFGYMALAMLAGIGVTISRGGYVSIACGLVLLFGVLVFCSGHRIAVLSAAVVIIGAGAWFVLNNFDIRHRLERAFDPSGKLADMRTDMWEPTVTLWKENLWFGVGPDHFALRFPKYRPDHFQFQADYTHNDYLNTLVDYGIVGLALICVVLFLTFLRVVWTWIETRKPVSETRTSEQKTSRRAFILLGGGVSLVTMAIHSLIDFNLHIPANAMLTVAILAVLTSPPSRSQKNRRGPLPLLLRSACSFLILAPLIYLSVQTSLGAAEQYYIHMSRRDGTGIDQRISFREKAFSFETRNFENSRAIGELYFSKSRMSGLDFEVPAREALYWSETSFAVNRHDYASCLLAGKSLDRLYEFEEAETWFLRAEAIDPKGFFTLKEIGLHYFEKGEYNKSLDYFLKSRHHSGFLNFPNTETGEFIRYIQRLLADGR